MMKLLLTLSACCCCVALFAGRSYTLAATRGDIVISSLSTSPELAPGDTLYIPAQGRYTSVQYRRLRGDSTHPIVIRWLPGSEVKAAYYQQLTSFNVSYVIIENMRHFNFGGTHKFSYAVHDVEFRNCQWVNPVGAYKDQPPIYWDDPYSPVSMVFKGKKAQTFYNITYRGCLFDGFQNITVIQLSTNWNENTPEIRRSICLDFEFTADTFRNITATAPVSVGAITGTGFGCRVNGCVFSNIMGPGSMHQNRSSSILWFGSIDVSGCLQENSYAHLLRCAPLGWSGMPGYFDNNTACRAWMNIVHNNLGYSIFEFDQDIRAGRDDLNSLHTIKAKCLFNTVFRTKRMLFDGPYYGFLADNLNQDSLELGYNLLVAPEYDFPFDVARGYIVAEIKTKPRYQSIPGNKIFKSWNRTILTDTTSFQPGPAVKLEKKPAQRYAFITTDFYGNPVAGGPAFAGAVDGPPPKKEP
jgi:hypothetical protein